MAVEIGLDNAIGLLHREEEKIIEESGIPFTFLRPSAFMQNFVNYFGQTIRDQNAFYLPAGDGNVSFVDARDIAAVYVQALTSGNQQHIGKAYTITGQEAISHRQAAEILYSCAKGAQTRSIYCESHHLENIILRSDQYFILDKPLFFKWEIKSLPYHSY